MRLQSPFLLGVVFLFGLLIGFTLLTRIANRPAPPITQTPLTAALSPSPQDPKVIARQCLNTLMAAVRDFEQKAPALLLQEIPENSPASLKKAMRDLKKATCETYKLIPESKQLIQRLLDDRGTPQDLMTFQSLAKTLIDHCSDGQKKKQAFDEEVAKMQAMIDKEKVAEKAREEARREEWRRDHELGVTMAAYDRIRQGMTKWEVTLVIGDSGTESSSAGSLATYTWIDGFRMIVATFDEGKLVAKAQNGL